MAEKFAMSLGLTTKALGLNSTLKSILKFILMMTALMLLFIGSGVYIYASDPIDGLDDRGQTESTAGITWDEIDEMSRNSPGSLTPIQGLVLWMFAIIAFLKLAQKMDNMLQSLGLNVTQTGGRALGDLMVAGMAIRNIGSAMSKGMGAFGFGRGSGGGPRGGAGTGGAGSGTGTSGAGGSGPVPIPTGGSRGAPPPTPGASGSRTAPGGALPTGVPPGTTPGSGAMLPGSTTATGAFTGSPPTGRASHHDSGPGPETASEKTGRRSPFGKAAEWMKEDGFAQGAIKAGAKGGLIGVGVYSIKEGASMIRGGAGHLADAGASSDANVNPMIGTDSNPIGQPNFDTENRGDGYKGNPEDYQDARPLDGSGDSASIPTTINDEGYREVKPYDSSDDGSSIPSSTNNEEYNDVGLSDGTMDYKQTAIPTSFKGDDGYDSKIDTSVPIAGNDEAWRSVNPVDGKSSVPIPITSNNDTWKKANPSSNPGGGASAQPSGALPIAPVMQGNNADKTATSKAALPQDTTATSVQVGAAQPIIPAPAAQRTVPNISSDDSGGAQTELTAVTPSSGSSTIVRESASDHAESAGNSVIYSGSGGSDDYGDGFDSSHMPMDSSVIPNDLPDEACQNVLSGDTMGMAANVPSDMSAQPPAMLQPGQAFSQETARVDLAQVVQPQLDNVVAIGEPANANVYSSGEAVQPQISNEVHVTKTEINAGQNAAYSSAQPASQAATPNNYVEKHESGAQPSATAQGNTATRTAEKGTSKRTSVKAGKRRKR